jgi:hypothetical protein
MPMLTEVQRSELEEMGAPNVRVHLLHFGAGRGADVGGFKCGHINRGEIVDWLAAKHQHDELRQRLILFWAVVGGVAGMASVGATIWFGLR